MTPAKLFIKDYIRAIKIANWDENQNVTRSYIRVVEDDGVVCLIDKDDIATATVHVNATGSYASIEPVGAMSQEDYISGKISAEHAAVLTNGLLPLDGVYKYLGETRVDPPITAVAAVAIRPAGYGTRYPDRKFVELQFKAGGYLRVICAPSHASALEAMVASGNEHVIGWPVDERYYLINRDQLSGIEVDEHEDHADWPGAAYEGSANDNLFSVRTITTQGTISEVKIERVQPAARR